MHTETGKNQCPDHLELSRLCTIITTTSPTPSNPSTELLNETLRSLGFFAPELLACRNILVSDGYKDGESSKFRNGVITEERAQAYHEYITALEGLVEKKPEPHWEHVEIIRLSDRHGFGFAVREALKMVETPFVCIMQHDRTFMRPCSFVLPLLRSMAADPRLKMVGMPTTSCDPSRHVQVTVTRLGTMKVCHPPFEETTITSSDIPGVRFMPMIMWLDSTHFASTDYYRNFVFGPRKLVSRGGFIEDRLGQQQGNDLREIGWKSHAEYGTWLLDDGHPPPTRLVGHLDGKKFLLRAERDALIRRKRDEWSKVTSMDCPPMLPGVDELSLVLTRYQARVAMTAAC